MFEEVKEQLHQAAAAAKRRDVKAYNELMEAVNESLKGQQVDDREVQFAFQEAASRAVLFQFETLILNMAKAYIAIDENLKAYELLSSMRPPGLHDSAALDDLQSFLYDGIKHIEDFEEYRARYNDCDQIEHASFAHTLPRGVRALEVAKGLPQGAKVLSLGAGACAIENEIMKARPDLKLVVAELDGRFEENLKGKIAATWHIMKDWTDWTNDTYDLVLAFEIIEHMPDDLDVALAIGKRLNDTGIALVSTPVGYKWIEPPRVEMKWHPHVRAYDVESFGEVLRDAFNDVRIDEGWDRVFVAECRGPK